MLSILLSVESIIQASKETKSAKLHELWTSQCKQKHRASARGILRHSHALLGLANTVIQKHLFALSRWLVEYRSPKDQTLTCRLLGTFNTPEYKHELPWTNTLFINGAQVLLADLPMTLPSVSKICLKDIICISIRALYTIRVRH